MRDIIRWVLRWLNSASLPKIDVDISDSAVYTVAISDSAVYTVTLSDTTRD